MSKKPQNIPFKLILKHKNSYDSPHAVFKQVIIIIIIIIIIIMFWVFFTIYNPVSAPESMTEDSY